ncbi:phage-Barnase-EndoU-ColicinE5/D-RelE like nuclease4 [anaerobic digester metagenome]
MLKKEEILSIIIHCAKIYDENLKNKNYLIIFNEGNSLKGLETIFHPRNFLHLTGIDINKSEVKTSNEFYKRCLKNKLKSSDFDAPSDGTVELKLSVLPHLMQLHRNTNMIGTYDGSKINLQTDKIVGNIKGVLGFVYDNGYFVPNTALKADIRDITTSFRNRVVAIYSKSKNDEKYTHIRYLAKGVKHEDIIKSKILALKFIFDDTIIEDFKEVKLS